MAVAEMYLSTPGVIECAGRRVKLHHLSADAGTIAVPSETIPCTLGTKEL